MNSFLNPYNRNKFNHLITTIRKWWIEDQYELGLQKCINKIDELGGSVKAIEQEFQQNEISSSAFNYQKSIDEGRRIFQVQVEETSLGIEALPPPHDREARALRRA